MDILIGFILGFGVTLLFVFYIANRNSKLTNDTNGKSIELMQRRNELDEAKVVCLKQIAEQLKKQNKEKV